MADYKHYITQIQENGNIMISEDVVSTIVTQALTEVEGVAGFSTKPGADIAELFGKKNQGLKIQIAEDNSVTLICNVMVYYGHSVMEVASNLEKEYYAQLAAENDVYNQRPNSAQLTYIDSVVSGVANREDELNALIQKYSIGWDVTRISRLARSILQLALFEIQFVEDVPTGVAVNEAVRIAKKYDGNDTGSFVNGILGSFARSLATPAVEEEK